MFVYCCLILKQIIGLLIIQCTMLPTWPANMAMLKCAVYAFLKKYVVKHVLKIIKLLKMHFKIPAHSV